MYKIWFLCAFNMIKVKQKMKFKEELWKKYNNMILQHKLTLVMDTLEFLSRAVNSRPKFSQDMTMYPAPSTSGSCEVSDLHRSFGREFLEIIKNVSFHLNSDFLKYNMLHDMICYIAFLIGWFINSDFQRFYYI